MQLLYTPSNCVVAGNQLSLGLRASKILTQCKKIGGVKKNKQHSALCSENKACDAQKHPGLQNTCCDPLKLSKEQCGKKQSSAQCVTWSQICLGRWKDKILNPRPGQRGFKHVVLSEKLWCEGVKLMNPTIRSTSLFSSDVHKAHREWKRREEFS